MTQRRQVGFIKTFISTPSIPQQPSEFSYFKVNPRPDDDEFSPYKFQEDLKGTISPPKALPRPPLPQRSQERPQTAVNLGNRVKADQLYNKIKQNIASYEDKRRANRHNLQENIGNIRNKIEKLDEVLKDLKFNKEVPEKRTASYSQKRKFESESSSSEDDSEEYVVKAIPSQVNSPKVHKGGHETIDRKVINVDFNREEESQKPSASNNSLSQPSQDISQKTGRSEANVITFNSRLKNQPPLRIQQYSSSSSEEEDSQSISEQQIQQQLPPSKSANVFKNKGGVCFDVDVKQFTAPVVEKEEKRPVVPAKKKKPVDKRLELLKRREAAKVYDKMARRAVFSPHY